MLTSLLLSGRVAATGNDGLSLDAELEDANSMTWPMLPGENLNDVARLFYPKNQPMQRQFVAKTLLLSTNIQDNLRPEKRFEAPTLLVIPTLKSLSQTKNAHTASRKKSHKQKLQLSYDLNQAVEKLPAKLLQDYEWLVNKNAFLKEELAKLNQKITFLQLKLNDLKLILDKTLNISNAGSQTTSIDSPASSLSADNLPPKKVFKNLNSHKLDHEKTTAVKIETTQSPIAMRTAESSLFDHVNLNLIIFATALLAMLIAGAFALKKYRQRMFASFTDAIPEMDDTVLDFGGHWKDEAQDLNQQTLQEIEKVIKNTEAKVAQPKGVLMSAPQNTVAKTTQPSLADATLVEAKLLVSIDRSTDAIEHLKTSIESSPKASINHWLYLLEIFRKLNAKEEFEKYAKGLKTNFNVVTQAWDDSIAPSTLPQLIEEYPNIIEKLCAIWPTDEAKEYLRSLITDNRDGDRVGFGKAVLSEILFLVALLDTRKDFN